MPLSLASPVLHEAVALVLWDTLQKPGLAQALLQSRSQLWTPSPRESHLCPLCAWASGLGTVLGLWSLEGAGEHTESTQDRCLRVGFVSMSVPELLQDPCCGHGGETRVGLTHCELCPELLMSS